MMSIASTNTYFHILLLWVRINACQFIYHVISMASVGTQDINDYVKKWTSYSKRMKEAKIYRRKRFIYPENMSRSFPGLLMSISVARQTSPLLLSSGILIIILQVLFIWSNPPEHSRKLSMNTEVIHSANTSGPVWPASGDYWRVTGQLGTPRRNPSHAAPGQSKVCCVRSLASRHGAGAYDTCH